MIVTSTIKTQTQIWEEFNAIVPFYVLFWIILASWTNFCLFVFLSKLSP